MRADPVRSRNSHQKTQTDGRNAQRAVRSHSYIGLSEPKRELLANGQSLEKSSPDYETLCNYGIIADEAA